MDSVQTFELGLWLLASGLLLELLVYLRAVGWGLRRYLAASSMVISGFASGLIIFSLAWPLALFFIFIQVYRLFNLSRIMAHRQKDIHLRKVALRSSLAMILLCGAGFGGQYLLDNDFVVGLQLLAVIALLQLGAAAILLANALGNFINMRLPALDTLLSDKELPTLTVAIPARNETYDMAACLESLLASDYSKLEILVLDDCSQDSTPEIIRSFAHKGVRFLNGTVPKDSWLAKNHALNQLASEANGELILFCGVDIRFDTGSLRRLVSLHTAHNLSMLSLLPKRSSTFGRHFLLQPMRYWHEVAMPRLFSRTPPVLSSCWLVNTAQLDKAGGFEAYHQAINPERFIARYFNRRGTYRFYRSSPELGIDSHKNLDQQWNTAVRTRYPETHRRLETVCLLTFAELFVLVGPLVLIGYAAYIDVPVLWNVALLSLLLLILTHLLILRASGSKWPLIALVNFPFVICAELFVLNYSMWRYEFSEVYWKGRNVCIPVLRAIPHLPVK